MSQKFKSAFTPVATALLLAFGAAAANAATILITSRDAPGIGFNDPTPVDPVGGNNGTTLGAQRWNVYQHVAQIWEQALQSNVTITVSAGWEALTCSSTSAVLGSAGAWNIWHDFSGGMPGTWYPQALANKISGVDQSAGQPDDGSGYGNVDIKTQFNINLGNTGCLDGQRFYLGFTGYDNSKGVNFAETLLHELGHGLGFSVLTVNTATGQRLNAAGTAYSNTGLPSIWEGFMYDNTVGKTWLAMSVTERKNSAINPLGLAWKSDAMLAAANATLTNPVALQVATPAPTGAGAYLYNTASFGPAVPALGTTFGPLATVPSDAVNGAGCLAFDAPTSASVAGKVAIIDRGVCAFTQKAKNAQNAGAIGVVIANNAAGAAPGLGGTDATIVIPTVSVSQTDGVTLKQAVVDAAKYGTRGKPGTASAKFSQDLSKRAGADVAGRPLLYTPNPLVSGSSVSHWDVGAFPNLLMEPNINVDLTTVLVPPLDLTKPLLQDLGW